MDLWAEDYDVYTEEGISDMADEESISNVDEAFMRGYIKAFRRKIND